MVSQAEKRAPCICSAKRDAKFMAKFSRTIMAMKRIRRDLIYPSRIRSQNKDSGDEACLSSLIVVRTRKGRWLERGWEGIESNVLVWIYKCGIRVILI